MMECLPEFWIGEMKISTLYQMNQVQLTRVQSLGPYDRERQAISASYSPILHLHSCVHITLKEMQ